jgi:glycosyltransferase involved in cell wall biosynthesis
MTVEHTILIVADAFWPQRTGGITKSLLTEVAQLTANGHEVVVVTRKLQRDSLRHESRDGYELHRYRSPPTDSRLYHAFPLFSFGLLPRLVDRLDGQFEFDLAYVHNVFQSVGIERASSTIPQVYTYHAPLSGEVAVHADKGKYSWKTPAVRAVNHGFERLERHVIESADALVLRSRFMYDELSNIHGMCPDTDVLPLCVDMERFAFTENPETVRDDINLPTDRTILLTVRRLVPRTGVDTLIEAMNTVTEEHPDALLLVGGTGYLESQLEAQVRENGLQDHVRLLGFVPEDDLPTYYGAADLSVMPTKKLEGFGLSTIESLSCGTPVVATPVGANPEVLGPLREDLLCADASAAGLTERLGEWIERGVSSDLRAECRTYCENNFSAQTVIGSLENLFDAAT